MKIPELAQDRNRDVRNEPIRRAILPIFLKPKEKAWSAKLLKGHVVDNPMHGIVKADICESCHLHTPKFVALYHGDPEIQSHGCERCIRVLGGDSDRILIKARVDSVNGNARKNRIDEVLQDIVFRYRLIESNVGRSHEALNRQDAKKIGGRDANNVRNRGKRNIRTIQKTSWGSYVIVISKYLLVELGWENGTEITQRISKHSIVMERANRAPNAKAHTRKVRKYSKGKTKITLSYDLISELGWRKGDQVKQEISGKCLILTVLKGLKLNVIIEP